MGHAPAATARLDTAGMNENDAPWITGNLKGRKDVHPLVIESCQQHTVSFPRYLFWRGRGSARVVMRNEKGECFVCLPVNGY